MSTNKRNAKRYNNNKRRSEQVETDYTSKEEVSKPRKGKNDLSWHAKSDALLNEAASIPWSWATGRPIVLRGGYDTAPDVNYQHTIPGILAVRTAITPGTGIAKSDALNIAAQALYTDVRRMLKSANQYEASDVMIYLTAVGEVMACISWFTRLYATTMLYSYRNAYLPDALIKMQGVDPAGLHNHALEFLSRANQLIAKASQIYIPKGLDFLERCRWEYANYYSEGDDIKDQIYMFTPGLFRKFVLSSEQDYKGMLTPALVIKDGANLSYEHLLLRLEEMIEALIGDSDFANIAGDLMNRYGESGVMTFSLIPQDAVMQILSGPAAFEVLEQIQNARALRAVRNEFRKLSPDAYGNPTGTSPIFQVMQGSTENQILVVNTQVTLDLTATGARADFIGDAIASLLTVHESPSAAKTMLITRFQNQYYGVEDAVTEASAWVEAAADLVIDFEVGYFNTSGNLQVSILLSTINESNTTYDANILRVRPFHYFPNIYLHNGTVMTDIYGALDIVAPITVEQLRDINRVDLMSLFAVPDVGKVTK